MARVVRTKLRNRRLSAPPIKVLDTLFETMYFASLRTEEAESIRFYIVYIDPQEPDPDPPERVVRDRWSIIRFAAVIEVTIANVVKLAKATDPRTSAFAVFSNDQEDLFIWGLVDQANRYYDFINHESPSGSDRPGLFQSSILGIGHLAAYIRYERIAELKTGTLIGNTIDVFRGGPVLDTLFPSIETFKSQVRTQIPNDMYFARPHWNDSLRNDWIKSLCRLLLRIQGHRHGGAILITPGEVAGKLDVKYQIMYDRLTTALIQQATSRIEETFATDEIHEVYLEEEYEEMPVDLYLDAAVPQFEVEESNGEIDGTIWFISLLSRVDGLVLMDTNLKVQGFGVEIIVKEEPAELYLATDVNASPEKLRRLDYRHFGTRHRSMMR